MSATTIDTCDIAAYRTWTTGPGSLAHVRGMPTWVRPSALSRPRQHPRAVR